MQLRESAIERTKAYEGWAEHFYLDSVGCVTVGYGRMLPNAASAATLTLRKNGVAASPDELRNEWAVIKAQEPNHLAAYYRPFTTLTLDEAVGRQYLVEELRQSAGYVATAFPALETFPPGPQDALLDMMFNMGPTRFSKTSWPNLFAAVANRNWAGAAAQSKRQGIGDDRNKAIRDLFMSATLVG